MQLRHVAVENIQIACADDSRHAAVVGVLPERPGRPDPGVRRRIYRVKRPVRIPHWINGDAWIEIPIARILADVNDWRDSRRVLYVRFKIDYPLRKRRR